MFGKIATFPDKPKKVLLDISLSCSCIARSNFTLQQNTPKAESLEICQTNLCWPRTHVFSLRKIARCTRLGFVNVLFFFVVVVVRSNSSHKGLRFCSNHLLPLDLDFGPSSDNRQIIMLNKFYYRYHFIAQSNNSFHFFVKRSCWRLPNPALIFLHVADGLLIDAVMAGNYKEASPFFQHVEKLYHFR